MAAFKTYEEIAAWAMGRELVKEIYRLTKDGLMRLGVGSLGGLVNIRKYNRV